MTDRVDRAGLAVAAELAQFVEQEALDGLELDAGTFWERFAALIADFTPLNERLLARRDELQDAIDAWHRERGKGVLPADDYEAFLREIGYLVPEGPAFEIGTAGVDTEITAQPGPQLVVPVMNARFALNAANARWGSLYDALYGTDAIPADGGAEPGGAYNPVRGERVIARGRELLDLAAPLETGSHADASAYRVRDSSLEVELGGGSVTPLKHGERLRGYAGEPGTPSAVLLVNNGLHIEIAIDRDSAIGKTD
ncbi:MAG: malate synthase G, partial [Pseudomonadota bacterium]